MICREGAVQLHREQEAIAARGAGLFYVGNGDTQFAHEFKDALRLEAPVYLDPTRESYRALGMRHGIAVTVGSAASWQKTLRALRSGFHAAAGQGDPWQNGGLLVVRPDGSIAFKHIDESAADHASTSDVLASLGEVDRAPGAQLAPAGP